MKIIKDTNQLEMASSESEQSPVVLFKHSTSCPISKDAFNKIRELDKKIDGATPLYMIVVQESRDISNQVEKLFNIKHETPQVIIVKNREAIYDANHYNISTESILSQVSS